MTVIWYLVFQIWSATDKIFCHFGPFFLHFYPPNNPKYQNFENVKKVPGDIIILHKCTINHDHMLYCSLDMARIGFNCYFSFWAIFYLFTSLQALRTLFHIEVAQIFQKRASSRHLKQLSLEQDPGYNTR